MNEQRHVNDRDEQPAVTETDSFTETVRELGDINISNHADGDNMDCQNASEFAQTRVYRVYRPEFATLLG